MRIERRTVLPGCLSGGQAVRLVDITRLDLLSCLLAASHKARHHKVVVQDLVDCRATVETQLVCPVIDELSTPLLGHSVGQVVHHVEHAAGKHVDRQVEQVLFAVLNKLCTIFCIDRSQEVD